MNMKKVSVGVVVAILSVSVAGLVASQVLAQESGSDTGNIPSGGSRMGMQGGRGPGFLRHGGRLFRPSDASIAACNGKSADDPCTFSFAGSDTPVSIDGTCMTRPSATSGSTDTVLSCVPTHKNSGKEGQSSGIRGDGIANGQTRLQRAQQMKTKKAEQIAQIENRIGNIITFLKSKGVGTGELSDELATFTVKADTFLAKIDKWVALLQATTLDQTAIAAAHDAVKTAGNDMRTYFVGTLRADIKASVDSLKD